MRKRERYLNVKRKKEKRKEYGISAVYVNTIVFATFEGEGRYANW
jgi:hypothetical protein